MTRRLRRRLTVSESNARDLVVFKQHVNWRPDPSKSYMRIKYYATLALEDLQCLLAHGYKVKVQDPRNMPSITELITFCNDTRRINTDGQLIGPCWTMHGYVIGPYCSDTQVCIEGVSRVGTYEEPELDQFNRMFALANEMTIEEHFLKAWFD